MFAIESFRTSCLARPPNCPLRRLLEAYTEAANETHSTQKLLTTEVLEKINTKHRSLRGADPNFRNWSDQQQDASETFGLLVDAFDLTETRLFDLKTRYMTGEEDDLRSEELQELHLDVTPRSSLQESIDHEFKSQRAEDTGIRQIRHLVKSPEILVVNVKRFVYSQEDEKSRRNQQLCSVVNRINTSVVETKNTTNVTLGSLSDDSFASYEFVGAVHHEGVTPAHGHYIAMIKNGSGYDSIDDLKTGIKSVRDDEANASLAVQGYMFFYRKVSDTE